MGIRLLAVTALALGATAAPAAAATVAPLKPCYVSAGDAPENRENVYIVGSGFTPGEAVDILVDGILVNSPTTDMDGNVAGTIDAPFRAAGEARFSVVLRDQSNPVLAATVTSRVTDLDVRMRPRETEPSERVRLRGRGFTRDAPIFAHYVFDGERQKRVRLAQRPTGPCGTFTARRRQIPIDNPRSGEWTIQIDQRRRYSPEPRPVWVQIPVTVEREFDEP
jgi:hypothetical protein